jgi:chemotaxis protein CheD
MHITNKDNRKHIIIHPGEYYVSQEDVVISTILGSCISACIYDPVSRIAGMNHFLLSNKRYSKDMQVCLSEAGRYGVNAMELIINDMLKLGAKRKNFRAKAFGGSSLLGGGCRPDSFLCVGDVNCRFIVEFLNNEGIPLVASNLGGNFGRVIRFSSSDYSVLMRRIRKTILPKLVKDERKFWLNSLKSQAKVAEPEIWGLDTGRK